MFARHVVVVEDESLLRDLIAKSLEAAGFTVSTAANAADAKRACAAVDPDAVVVDIELGAGPNGFDFADVLSRTSPDIGIVFLTNLPDARWAGRDSKSLPNNIAYLRKSQLVDSRDLVEALEAVLHETVSAEQRHDLDGNRPLAKLSRKQISVLQQLALGYSNAQIADKRGTTIRAVEGIVSRIFQALDIDVQAEGNARVEAAGRYLKASGKAIAEEE
jgi:DNA-binding NarL/FixJ family response regulator